MAAGFKNIEEADDVGIDIRARMVNAVPHTSLCRQVDDNIRLILLKECRDRRLIRQVTLNERELRILAQDFQATLLQPDIVIVIDIVKADNRRPEPQQTLRKMESDKARRTSDQDFFLRIKW